MLAVELSTLLRRTGWPRGDEPRDPTGDAADHGVEVFELGNGVDWHLVGAGGALFVRRCTRDLLAIIEAHRASRGSGALIIGNSGTGKSWSLLYFMLHYLLLGMTVLFESVYQDKCWVLRRDPAGEVSIARYHGSQRSDVIDALELRETVYLFDPSARGAQLRGCAAFTIVCASPTDDVVKYAEKAFMFLRVAPVWSLDELLAAPPYHGMDAATVRERYSIAGGNPRVVFRGGSAEAIKDDIRFELSTVALEISWSFARASFAFLELQHKPVEYTLVVERPPLSPFIGEALLAKARRLGPAQVARLAREYSGCVLGPLFEEAHARNCLQGAGVRLQVRRLDAKGDDDDEVWSLDCTDAVGDFSWDVVGLQWLQKRSSPALDAVYRGPLADQGPVETVLVQVSHLPSDDDIGVAVGQCASVKVLVLTYEQCMPSRTSIRDGVEVWAGFLPWDES